MMHANSLRLMQRFVDQRVTPQFSAGGAVLDVGSFNVNGTYRHLWDGWRYVGVDVTAGPNVDRVVPDDGWDLGERFDAVISGQCLEHCRRPWRLAETIGQHVKPGGLVCLIAPFAWPEHRYPLDCWRIAPDGMWELLAIAGCEPLDFGLSRASEERYGAWGDFVDCYGVGVKGGV